jgi:tetratricopeptide (TPR) repeat protein
MMKDIEERPEFMAYRKSLEMAWLDGVITYDEAKILNSLREYLHISEDEHWALENEVRSRAPDPGIGEYKLALEQAWMDGLLADDEKAMLKKLREKYNISNEIHKNLEMKVKLDLSITDDESKSFHPEPLLETKEDTNVDGNLIDKNSELYWINEGKKQWYSGKQNAKNGYKAIEYFDNAIRINPKSYIAWIYKGCIYKKIKNLPRAIQCYDKAIKLKKNFIASWYNKGMLLAQISLSQIEEAIKCFDEVLKINPNHELAQHDKEIFNKLAEVYVEYHEDN